MIMRCPSRGQVSKVRREGSLTKPSQDTTTCFPLLLLYTKMLFYVLRTWWSYSQHKMYLVCGCSIKLFAFYYWINILEDVFLCECLWDISAHAPSLRIRRFKVVYNSFCDVFQKCASNYGINGIHMSIGEIKVFFLGWAMFVYTYGHRTWKRTLA